MKSNLVFKQIVIKAMPPIEVEKMLNVLSLRHRKGYSQFELSFLMGQRDLYVRDVENANHTLVYSVAFNNVFRQIFDCSAPAIVPNANKQPGYEIRILQAVDESGAEVYSAEKKIGDGAWKLIDTLGEEPKEILLASSSAITAEQIQAWVDERYEGNYFYFPKSALTIFRDCERYFNESIRPIFLAEALQQYTRKKKAPRLIKVRDKFNGWDVFAKETSDGTAFLKVKIERFVSSDQLDLIECTLTDILGRKHTFCDNPTIFTDVHLDAKNPLPQWGVVAGKVAGRRKIKDPKTKKKKKVVKISTETPWTIRTVESIAEFEVFEDMVMG